MDFRHEFKYIISLEQEVILKERMKNLMQQDGNVSKEGSYEIRSIYFDDINDRSFFENEAGVDPRSKWRIRIYNHSDERIVLEKKSKKNGMTHKDQQVLTKEQYELLVQKDANEPDFMIAFHEQPDLVKELMTQMTLRMMKPKVIVSYERTPFVEKAGNVRVTFDDFISSASDIDSFFDKNLHQRPILPVGKTLMEVKYDEFLPTYIKEKLELGSLQQTSFSKYFLCRKYSL